MVFFLLFCFVFFFNLEITYEMFGLAILGLVHERVVQKGKYCQLRLRSPVRSIVFCKYTMRAVIFCNQKTIKNTENGDLYMLYLCVSKCKPSFGRELLWLSCLESQRLAMTRTGLFAKE